MQTVDEELRLQSSLNQIRDNLAALTNSPAATHQQASLATALQTLTDGANRIHDEITPAQLTVIQELAGTEYFDPAIADNVRTTIERNAMTPSVARDYVQDLTDQHAHFLLVSECRTALRNLIPIEELAGQTIDAEAAFTIPRDLFGNQFRPSQKKSNSLINW